ncbi:MAG: hypothetical protein AB1716_03920 [Planctomycetota bacterium]
MSSDMPANDRLILLGVGVGALLAVMFWIGFGVGDEGIEAIKQWLGRLFR